MFTACVLIFGVIPISIVFYSFKKIRGDFRNDLAFNPGSDLPRKWIVGGMMGSGKSTFSAALSKKLGIAHIEIDKYVSEIESRIAIDGAAFKGWVVEANPWQIPVGLADEAEIIVFLDYDNVVNYIRLLTRGLHEWREQNYSWTGFKKSILNRTIFDLGRIVFLHGKSNRLGWRENGLLPGANRSTIRNIRCTSPAELKQLELSLGV